MFPKLVLSTSNLITHLEIDDLVDNVEHRVAHRYLVNGFRCAFAALCLELEVLGYEVFSEFYVDALIDEDYELSLGDGDREEVRELVDAFHTSAQEILVGLVDA